MKRLLPVALLAWLTAFAGGAWADTCQYSATPPTVGDGKQAQIQCDSTGRITTISKSPGVTGFGKLSLTNASTLLSTATVGPGSAAWPAIPGIVDVTNDPVSADTIYACPVGSTPTCTTATGIPIYVGQSFRFTGASTTMTLIATSTATVEVQF